MPARIGEHVVDRSRCTRCFRPSHRCPPAGCAPCTVTLFGAPRSVGRTGDRASPSTRDADCSRRPRDVCSSSSACCAASALVIGVVLANALAATAGLAVPMILGGSSMPPSPSTGTWRRRSAPDLIVVAVIVAHTCSPSSPNGWPPSSGTCPRQARRRIIDTVLRLPLGRVERERRRPGTVCDVGSMSECAVRDPGFIIGVITVGLSLVAMAVNSWLLAIRPSSS